MSHNTLGERIADSLKHNGLTQRELAKQIGVTEVSVSRYISDDRIPKGPIIAKIAAALHTTSDYLLGTEDDSDFEIEYDKIRRLIAHNVSKMNKKQRNELIQVLLEFDFS